jgi:hypothetical protein
MCTLVFMREKGKKKYKQLIIDSNPTIICLQVSYHREEGMVAYLVRRWMDRFINKKAPHTSL